MRGVYVLHIEPAYKHAAHYTGWSSEIEGRVLEHLSGKGARLCQVAIEAGCHLILSYVEQGANRERERAIKSRGAGRCVCPICNGQSVQLPLGLGVVAAFALPNRYDAAAEAAVLDILHRVYGS